MELSIAQYLGLRSPSSGTVFRFQNYWINQTASLTIPFGGADVALPHNFLPFGFSGISIDRQGDLKEATLIFPNTEPTRGWIDMMVKERWFATVRTIIPNSLEAPDPAKSQILFTYIGVITTASWADTEINATVSTVLDAVGNDAPTRRITRSVVGSIPTTASVRLQ
jgi:hypothetical protein